MFFESKTCLVLNTQCFPYSSHLTSKLSYENVNHDLPQFAGGKAKAERGSLTLKRQNCDLQAILPCFKAVHLAHN